MRNICKLLLLKISTSVGNVTKGDSFWFFKLFLTSSFIISASLRLLLSVWIWYRQQNRIENCHHHHVEKLGFYKKLHIKTHSKEKAVLVMFILQETKNFNLLDTKNINLFYKNWTQKNVNCHILHILHEVSWLRWIENEQAIYK